MPPPTVYNHTIIKLFAQTKRGIPTFPCAKTCQHHRMCAVQHVPPYHYPATIIGNDTEYLCGLFDTCPCRGWYSGAEYPSNYTAWAEYQPDNYFRGQGFNVAMLLDNNKMWDDYYHWFFQEFVCERKLVG
jgi:hypothetical protein